MLYIIDTITYFFVSYLRGIVKVYIFLQLFYPRTSNFFNQFQQTVKKFDLKLLLLLIWR